jgi:hypothetical protein
MFGKICCNIPKKNDHMIAAIIDGIFALDDCFAETGAGGTRGPGGCFALYWFWLYSVLWFHFAKYYFSSAITSDSETTSRGTLAVKGKAVPSSNDVISCT